MPEGPVPAILVADDPAGAVRVAADLLVAWLAGAVGQRGIAHVALTGGSSAAGLYTALREPARALALDWSRVHAWLGDDRFVPLDQADSNSGVAARALTGAPGPLPPPNLHPMPVWLATPDAAAEAYLAEVRTLVPSPGGVPAFDVVLLGMGGDGHLLSVFPGSTALAGGAPVALGIPAPTHIAPHVPRVTFSPVILAAARHVMPIVAGAGKADILRTVLGSEHDPTRWPAQLALRANATWVLDRAAAAGLPRA